MIYDVLGESDPICQGDIFSKLPRIDLSLEKMVIVTKDEERAASWAEISSTDEPLNAILPLRSVAAIVATQDCDAQHERDITLCEIRPFLAVGGLTPPSTPKKWTQIITKHSRVNLKWFYLPPDDQIGFSEKMAVDFRITIRVPRKDLEGLLHLRKGRLNSVAYEHFRERLSEFFRRYPYDEWYPLDPSELAAYKEEHPDVAPFPWQTQKG
jgi:hypothetical protein